MAHATGKVRSGSNPAHPPSSATAVGYVRVSTGEQRLGPKAQRQSLKQWCLANGVKLVAVFSDRVSGAAGIDQRPGLLAALAALRDK